MIYGCIKIVHRHRHFALHCCNDDTQKTNNADLERTKFRGLQADDEVACSSGPCSSACSSSVPSTYSATRCTGKLDLEEAAVVVWTLTRIRQDFRVPVLRCVKYKHERNIKDQPSSKRRLDYHKGLDIIGRG